MQILFPQNSETSCPYLIKIRLEGNLQFFILFYIKHIIGSIPFQNTNNTRLPGMSKILGTPECSQNKSRNTTNISKQSVCGM